MPARLRRPLCAALLLLVALPAAAQARSEQAIFTVELSGTYSAGWSSPGVANCGAPDPVQARGHVNERGSFRTKEAVPIVVQGLWGRDLQFYRLRDSDQGSIPVDVEIAREGALERVVCTTWEDRPRAKWYACNTPEQQRTDPDCSKVEPIATDGCFGERRFTAEAVLGLAPFAVYSPGDVIDQRVFGCTMDGSFMPGSLIGGWDAMAAKAKTGPAKFKSAKPGTAFTLRGTETKPCRQPAPATCTPATLSAQATFRFVCRSRTSMRGCLTPKLRRKLKLG
jgi:hypothetical protein